MTVNNAHQAIEVYTQGTKAWFEDVREAWISATCISNTVAEGKVRLVFQSDNDDEKEYVFETTLEEVEKTDGSKLPPLRNPPKMEYTDDLTNLSYLNEPSVLNTIRTRYLQRLIYTYSGIVLIAVNPFDRVALYDPDIVQQYSGRRRGELEPHLFAIAEDAYRCMIREQMNQTIVVSGESGAGKTVSAKYIMRYFATADDQEAAAGPGRREKSNTGMTEVEEQILATNPIMEAFGNAKTTRNDNSSRFGKYIEIQFDDNANIVGAKIRTYLLERSRLIFQLETERNYHIFYQLCAGIPLSERKEFDLTSDYTQFHYLNQSGTGTIPGVDDANEFDITQRALSTIGLSVQLQWKIFRLLAALLHIGNIKITGRGDAMLSDTDPALLTSTRLLGISTNEFRKWIVRKQIITRSEKIVTNLSPTQAQVVKDSVAKYIYANLFEWLVYVINESLSCPSKEQVSNFIGVLDIYGFEHFKKNSFEQFCINYANEKLQQQFNQHVFKLEQEEYVREKINWTFIEFSDNQKCIELIEGKLGILSLLDEESRLPSGSDQGFVQKLYSNFDGPNFKQYFKKPRFSNNAFTIAHYALDVQYEAENFIDKNKDTVPDEHLSLLQSSEFDFLVDVLEKAVANNPTSAPESNKRMSMVARKPTLGSIFKLSLINLMDTIGSTNVHYIRCIKPNEAKVAWEFDPGMVLSQLRACGVLETIRISCAGYPSRWSFEEFADRYYALVSSQHWDPRIKEKPDVKELCSVILKKSIKDDDKFQAGTTKIFFRAGQLAYLEKLRSDRYNECAILLQKNMRRFIYRTRYVRTKELTVQLQCLARKKAAQNKMQLLRKEKAAIIIQKNWRTYLARRAFLSKLAFILKLQTAIRAKLGRSQYISLRENHAAVQIQRLARGWFARKKYSAQRKSIIHIQACVRRIMARKQLYALRAEARSVNHFKEVSYALENKVVELTQTLTAVREEKKVATDRAVQLEAQIRTWQEKYEKAERRAKQLDEQLQLPTVPKEEYDTIQKELSRITSEHRTMCEMFKQQENERTTLRAQLEAEKAEKERINKELQEANERAEKQAADELEISELRSQITALKTQLSQALNAPRRQNSTNNVNGLRGLSPAPNSMRDFSPSPNRNVLDSTESRHKSRSPIPSNSNKGTINNATPISTPPLATVSHKLRRNSSSDMVNDNRLKTSLDTIRQAENFGKNPRPTSIDHIGALLGAASKTAAAASGAGGLVFPGLDDETNPVEEIHALLRQTDALEEEILQGLIRTVRMPLPALQNPPSHKEIMFPAHAIGVCVHEMWRLGYVGESERLLFNIMDTIQKQLLAFNDEDAVVPCTFWLTNVHELVSLICTSHTEIDKQLYQTQQSKAAAAVHRQDFNKLVETIKFEMQCLEDNIYHAWMKEIKKHLSKMIISAVVEGQSLPGFVTNEGTRFFNKLLIGSSQPHHFYLIAMQIQYNITRIEEWCKSHNIPEGSLQLEHLMQATKLLQFKKATPEDIENIYDVCWILSPTQVQKLISQYHIADYENPIRPEILKAVASHVVSGDKSDILLLDSVPIEITTNPFEVPVPRDTKPDMYLPSFVS
ncbi:P-loop containing nucleoside triphosphate hydrolase protein [Mycotypha africana]|uniref:P-loop containing nucleoside triphosphate hydrolase protein n=1 Tax=Mycotypha africana TaxID=64632 RepID=UPI002301F1ED|nr:P-loop containing nucleoside triphosphate hydrolase protein [Mycotypha africana]KAI8991579.1 P-loop containing nucleoside triphosphate hydrolase protein [Mycotypha africana]